MKSKRFLLLIGIILTVISVVDAQSFTITEMNYYDKTPSESIQDYKKDGLGATIKLTEYGNDLKVEMIDNNDKKDSIILQKIEDNTYETRRYDKLIKLTINSFLGYYKSIIIEQWRNGKLEVEFIAKRK